MITALKLSRQGLKKSEISKVTGIKPTTVPEAIKRGEDNIQRAIDIIKIATENNILTDEEKSALKCLLRKT